MLDFNGRHFKTISFIPRQFQVIMSAVHDSLNNFLDFWQYLGTVSCIKKCIACKWPLGKKECV